MFCGTGSFGGEWWLFGDAEIAFFVGEPMLGENIRIGFTGFAQVRLERTFTVLL